MISNKNLINIKVVEVMKIYNFLFWSSCHLTKSEPFKFEILKNDKFEPKFETQIYFNIKSDKDQSCSTHEYLQLLFLSFLHLTNS